MLPDRVSNPGPLTYESDALPIALRGPAITYIHTYIHTVVWTIPTHLPVPKYFELTSSVQQSVGEIYLWTCLSTLPGLCHI